MTLTKGLAVDILVMEVNVDVVEVVEIVEVEVHEILLIPFGCHLQWPHIATPSLGLHEAAVPFHRSVRVDDILRSQVFNT